MVRAYTSEPVPTEVVDRLLDLARRAPPAGNTQAVRFLVLDTPEAVEVGGFGAEIVARVVDRLGPSGLKSAKRIGAPRIPIPFAPPLENEVRVTAEKIVAMARSMVS